MRTVAVKLVESLGGKPVGTHWVITIPRTGDYIVGPDSKVWKVEAVGHYSSLTEHLPGGPIAEIQVTDQS